VFTGYLFEDKKKVPIIASNASASMCIQDSGLRNVIVNRLYTQHMRTCRERAGACEWRRYGFTPRFVARYARSLLFTNADR